MDPLTITPIKGCTYPVENRRENLMRRDTIRSVEAGRDSEARRLRGSRLAGMRLNKKLTVAMFA